MQKTTLSTFLLYTYLPHGSNPTRRGSLGMGCRINFAEVSILRRFPGCLLERRTHLSLNVLRIPLVLRSEMQFRMMDLSKLSLGLCVWVKTMGSPSLGSFTGAIVAPIDRNMTSLGCPRSIKYTP